MVAAAKIQAIYRYPVKGLSPEPLPRAWLAAGETLPGDRAFAIENGPSRFDPARPRYQPKTQYLMLMRNERLAALKTRFDPPSRTLVIARAGHEATRGDLGTSQGRAAIEAFFAHFCADELRGPPRVLHAPGFSFSDVARKVVSIINLASVEALAQQMGARDLAIPDALQQAYGHADCGIYGEVVEAGEIAVGDGVGKGE
jgi:uncharacterized protein YcbX